MKARKTDSRKSNKGTCETELPSTSSFLSVDMKYNSSSGTSENKKTDTPWTIRHSTPIAERRQGQRSGRNTNMSAVISPILVPGSARSSAVLSPIQVPGSGGMSASTNKAPREQEPAIIPREMGDECRFNDTDTLVAKYKSMLQQVNIDIKSELDNDIMLQQQDKEIEKHMALLDKLREEDNKLTRQLVEVAKINNVFKEIERKHRIAYNTNMLDEKMFSINSDKTQEEIWKIREEVIELEHIQDLANPEMRYMCSTNLNERLMKERNENDIQESNLQQLQEELEVFRTGEWNTSTREGKSDNGVKNGLHDKYIVLPKIHRRNNDIGMGNIALSERKVFKLKTNKVEPLPPIRSQTGLTRQTPTGHQTSDVPCIKPRPPSAKKSARQFTRNHLLHNLII